jgi:hypothetical protein
MLEVTQSPDQLYTLVAGDATMAYTAAYGHNDIDTKLPFSSFVSPELLDVFYARRPEYRSYFAQTLKVATLDYNPMRYVIRSILFVRGPRPYALIVDDCDKNDQPQDWRWTMNDCEGFAPGQSPAFIGPDGKWAPTSLVIQPGATPADAVVYHSPIDDEQRPGQTGLPRLLVRDVGLTQYAGVPQPPIILERRTPENGFTYGVDNNSKKAVRLDSNCLLIERDRVVAPNYKVLLFPYRTGEATPVTAWNAGRTRLTIDIGEGIVDTIGFDQTHPDRRTRITFSRTGATPPGS